MLANLFLSSLLCVLVITSGAVMLSAQHRIYQLQWGLARFLAAEAGTRDTLRATLENARFARIYATAADARSGDLSKVALAGDAVRMEYSRGTPAGGAAAWAATIEYDADARELVYYNINNGKFWTIARRIDDPEFRIVDGVFVLTASVEDRSFSIYVPIQ